MTNELVLPFGGTYVCANFGENRSRNATVRVLTDGQIHRQMQTNFIICPMLYAIAMGQIINNNSTKLNSNANINSASLPPDAINVASRSSNKSFLLSKIHCFTTE